MSSTTGAAPVPETVNGGELIARTLAAHGVRHAFGVHGGHLDALLTAMVRHGIRLVDHRHEAAAGNAAEGYARTTGGLGVVFATAGPGFTNVYSAIANAHCDRIPILVLTSSPPQREVELNVLQGAIDQVAVSLPITRWAHRATTAARLPDLVSLAVRHATCGVPGPVLLDVPIDVMFRPIDPATASDPCLTVPEPPGPSAHAVARSLQLLARAERPLLIVGGGAAMSPGLSDALEAFLDAHPLPVVTSSWGAGALPSGHRCLHGGPGDLVALPLLAQPPDLVLLLGARRGISLGGRSHSSIPAGAAVVQVDLDGVEPGRIGAVDLAVRSDAAEFLRALLAAAPAGALRDWAPWLDATVAARGAHAMLYAESPAVTESGRLHPYHAARAAVSTLDADSVGIFDGGEVSGWVSLFARAQRRGSWFGLGMLGGLGVGPGFAIGAAVGRPGERIVLFAGDGALGFHIGELDTMVRHDLPITVVVFNNEGWGMSLHGQQAIYGEDTRVVVDLLGTRYDRIAQAFGMAAERIEDPEAIGAAMERARVSGGPALVELAIAPEVVHPMMQQMLTPLPEGHTRVPYYESIPAGEA
ncbi:MAG TPA: thiamine pyrophosphate-binding protein [Acidimicrobiales bacterium]|nr:thiamine pyrophosphate-binding protein [Acidimicrobiales bacterium]